MLTQFSLAYARAYAYAYALVKTGLNWKFLYLKNLHQNYVIIVVIITNQLL